MSGISDHPVAVAAIAAVGAFTVATALTFTWVVPTMTASLNHALGLRLEEVKAVERDRDSLKTTNASLQAQITALSTQLTDLTKEHSETITQKDRAIADLKANLFASQTANIFMRGSPYPLGFDKIKVGDPVSKIAEAYPFENVSKSTAQIRFDPASDIFRWVAFSHSVGEEKGVVEAVGFDIGKLRGFGNPPKPDLPDRWIESSLRRALGEPLITLGADNECLVWRLDDKEMPLVFHMRDTTSYLISVNSSPAGCFITDEQSKEIDRRSTLPATR